MKYNVKRIMATAMSAVMVASMGVSIVPVFYNNTANVSYAEDNQVGYKTGDTITFTKEDWKITHGSDKTSIASKLEVYATKLDRDGNSSMVAYLDGDMQKSYVTITYNDNYKYVAHVNTGIQSSTPDVDEWYYYDENTGEWVQFYANGGKSHLYTAPLDICFKKDTIPGISEFINDDTEIRINKDGKLFKTVGIIGEKEDGSNIIFVSGLEYQNYTWEMDVDYTEEYQRSIKTVTGTIYGRFLANRPYIVSKDLKVSTVITDNTNDTGEDLDSQGKPNGGSGIGGADTDTGEDTGSTPNKDDNKHGAIFDLQYPIVDEDGKPVIDENGNAEMGSIKDVEHGDAWIMKNAEVVQEISAGDLDYSIPFIEDYDRDATYFIKIGLDVDNTEFLYYRYNPRVGWWDFRVNTKDTPIYKAPVTFAEYPNEFSKGTAYSKKSTSNVIDGTEVDSWTMEEFAGGEKSLSVLTNDNNIITTVLFDYADTIGGGIYYQYVGIDPVPVYAYGERAKQSPVNKYDVPTNAESGDNLVVDGETEDGTHVHYELEQGLPNDLIPVLDGLFDVADIDKGIKGEVENGQSNDTTEEGVLNVVDPITESNYVIKDKSGDLVSEGSIKGDAPKVLSNLGDDTSIPSKQLEWMHSEPYYWFESISGVTNSINDDDWVKDEGYFVFDDEAEDTNTIKKIYLTDVKGDVNQDGTFSIADLVLEQKYLVGAITEEDNYTMGSFIASNLCIDNVSNVFDFVELRKLMLGVDEDESVITTTTTTSKVTTNKETTTSKTTTTTATATAVTTKKK